MRGIETPQAFAYIGELQQKKIRGQNFKRNEPGVIWDPKVVRLCMKLPYMRAVPLPEAMAGMIARTKTLKAQTAEPVEIPDDWKTLHHKRRMAIAKRLEPDVEIASFVQADAVIEKHKPSMAAPVVEPVAEAAQEAA